ncbi:MAG: glycoside hydrolase family 16 protein [Bacteroidetes bacterium]|nr:glycoside hydrolase family 16 protein [Bacteroidota bacterium]MDA1121166.1 glycoside hydrolase family 16 protein [Bacteroidota bacterium]
MNQILVITAFFIASLSTCSRLDKGMSDRGFKDDFNTSMPEYFHYDSRGNNAEFTRTFGAASPSEPSTKILSFKIDPEDPAGAGRGPEIISNDFTHFGTYAARIKVPDPREKQPDVGAVVGYFTYHMDSIQGLSEIDYEWLIADPEVIYIGTWTGPRGKLRRIGRTINLAKGIIYSTTTREGHNGERTTLTGLQNQPETIPVIKGFDASSKFYTYGFDWHPDRIRWWMLHPQTADTVVFWDYQGSQLGIPLNQSRYRLNFWHSNNWSVQTNSNSLEKPLFPFEVEIDWMSYDPLED